MSFYQHEFAGEIARHSMGINKRGELFYTVVYVPTETIEALPLDEHPRLRVEGEIAEMPFEGAINPSKGRHYLMVSKKLMKARALVVGDEVAVRFNVGDQDYVDISAELQQALDDNPTAMALWDNLTAGRKRGFATLVNSAKRSATREARAAKVIGYILDGKNPAGR